jgi:hypothetical protein
MADVQVRRCGFASIMILTAQVLTFGQATSQESTAPITKKANLTFAIGPDGKR